MHILVAEDDKVSRELLRRILESDQKHAIDLTVDGTEAWQARGSGPCFRRLHPRHPDARHRRPRAGQPASAATARIARTPSSSAPRPTTGRRSTGGHLAVSGYIVKPYTRQRVLASIQRVASAEPVLPRRPRSRPRAARGRKIRGRCKRLGIDAATHATLLDGTLRDLREWLAQLRSAAPGADPAQLTSGRTGSRARA